LNSKYNIKIENKKNKKKNKQKKEEVSRVDQSPPNRSKDQPNHMSFWIPIWYQTDKWDRHGGGGHLLPLHLRMVATATTRTTSSASIRTTQGSDDLPGCCPNLGCIDWQT
jgi:hypothetical protein